MNEIFCNPFPPFQPPAKKMKVHNTFDVMTDFSQVWRKYPVLFDEKVRNQKFSENFKGASVYIRQDMATALGMTTEEVRKRHIKYVDGVTKGLGQLLLDIINETTTQCPIPAMYKLIAFHWLWPFSKNYDADLMEGVVFDNYMLRALTRDLNKLTHAKMDTTAVKEAIRVVKDFLNKKAMDTLDLKSATEQCEETVFADASELKDIEVFKDCVALTTICAYLPPSRDPMYKYAECGYVVFQQSVTALEPSQSGKGIRRRSDALLSALRVSGEAGLKATQALRQARGEEYSYFGSFAAILAHNELCANIELCSPDDKSEHSLAQLHTDVLRRGEVFHKSVSNAVTLTNAYVAEYNKLRSMSQQSVHSACRSQHAIDDIEKMRKLRDNSKRYSSDGWICVLMNQL